MTDVVLTEPLPLTLNLDRFASSGLFPQATVRDISNTLVATENLSEIGTTARYTNTAFTPSAEGIFTAQFIVYTNAGHTIESQVHGRASEIFSVRASLIDSIYQGAIWIDTTNGAAGVVVGVNGTPGNPVLTLADAVTLAAATGLNSYKIRGSITLTSAHTDWLFAGIDNSATLVFGSQNVSASRFLNMALSGAIGTLTAGIQCDRCSFGTGITLGFTGRAFECAINGDINIANGGAEFDRCFAASADSLGAPPVFDIVGATATLSIRSYSGGLEIQDVSASAHRVEVDLVGGSIVLDGSNTLGIITVTGVGTLDDSSSGSTVNSSGFIPGPTGIDANIIRIDGSAIAATNFREAAEAIIRGTVDDTTFPSVLGPPTVFETDILISTTDRLVRRSITFDKDASIAGQGGFIDAYSFASGKGRLSVSLDGDGIDALAAVPANGDTFVIS